MGSADTSRDRTSAEEDAVARMPRGRSTIVGALVALTVLMGAVDVITAPSAAALSAPVSKLAFGDRSLTLAWSKVPGAAGYKVQYSTRRTFSKPVTIDAGSRSWLQIKRLTNDKRYYARVVAVSRKSRGYGKILTASPDSGYPRALTVKAVSAGANRIRVSWSGQGRATKVAVLAGSNSTLDQHSFHSAWLPPTKTSVVLTVPTRYRSVLGTGSGNPIFVKVATYNSHKAGTAMPLARSMAAAYRLTLAGTRSHVGTVSPGGSRVRVATWNVNSVASTAGFAGYRWSDRRTKAAAGVATSDAALLATAELSTGDAGMGNGLRQWEDFRDLLARPGYGGYAIANTVTPGTTNGDRNATVGAHLFYKPGTLTRESGGIVSPKRLLGSKWPAKLTDRYFSWARFRVNTTGKTFYAVAVHLPAKNAAHTYPSLRRTEMAAIDKYMTAKAGGRPVVVMGDLNSTFAADPYSAINWLIGRGYYDTAATGNRSNAQYSTVNISKQIDNRATPGYPTRAYAYKYPAPRIDYILVKGSPGSWRYANQVVLRNGRFDPAFQGSDHNLQWAEIGIR
jgi:endonuclease/exonuclease/phosphatase family metal-dependent hydrolase